MIDILPARPRAAGYVLFESTVPVSVIDEIIVYIKEKIQDPRDLIDIHRRSAGDDGQHYLGIHFRYEPDQDGSQMDELCRNLIRLISDKTGSRGRRRDRRPVGVDHWSISTVHD